MKLTLNHQLTPSAQVLVQELGDEAVLLDLASERYFGLDPVGTRIWKLLGQDGRLRRVFAVLCADYAVEPSELQNDLLDLADQLADAGLVEVE
jgi:hypothetical protein